jgi:uncharacterized protein (TIGR03437 family)
LRISPSAFFAILLITPVFSHPLAFEQRSPSLFEARFRGGTATFRPDRVTLGPVTLRFPGGSLKSRWEGVGTSAPATYIYAGSTTTFRQYAKVLIRGLYPGVDASFYGNGDELEYDLSLAPGASPSRIRLAFEGARGLRIDDGGNLMIETASGVLEQKLPRVFQSGGRKVPARYVLVSPTEAEIRLGSYDAHSNLTIDPELAYARYFGGSGSDAANAIATDPNGNIYLAGTSNSVDFPATSGPPPKSNAPLFALSNSNRSGVTVTPVPIGLEDSVLGIGGTFDGKILYAVTSGGVYLSIDSGANWVQTAPPFNSLGMYPADQGSIGDISVDAIDPTNAGIATPSGLFFTHQAGQSWFTDDDGFSIGGNGGVSVTQVIISPINHLICYAVAGGLFAEQLYNSTDGCNTWHALTAAYPGEPALPLFPPSQVVIALAPNGNDLYVVDANAVLLKSTDGGVTWQRLAQFLNGSKAMTIDTSNPSNIYVLNDFGLQRSTDGGFTFATIVPFQIPGTPQGNPLQYFAFDSSSGTLYVSTFSSVFASTDGGKTLQAVMPLANVSLNGLTAIDGRVYAALNSSPRAFVMKLDPTGTKILYSTFFGGSQPQLGGLQVDAQGEAVVVGTVYSGDFPVTAQLSPASPLGQPSAFVAKLNANGTQLLYAAELGASKGVTANAMALDAAGAAYITGQTSSADFPTTMNAAQPSLSTAPCNRTLNSLFVFPGIGTMAFVTKLSPDGSSLVYSTFLNGSCGSVGRGLVVDSAGEAIVGGYTNAPDFQTTPNSYQPVFPGDPTQTGPGYTLTAGFLTKLSAAGDKPIASTFLGGGFATQAYALALDAAGNIVITGGTNGFAPGATPGAYQSKVTDRCTPTFSIGFSPPPTPNGDAFLLKLDPGLAVARSLTYLGGGCAEYGTALALDASGNSWILGFSNSADFPLRAPFAIGGNSFLTELDPAGAQLLFSTYTDGAALALDPAGAPLLAGYGASPTVPKRTQSFGGLGSSAELNKINPAVNPQVEIDGITDVTGFPSAVVNIGAPTIAPGQLIQITGHNLGPSTKVSAQLDSAGRLPDAVANVTVKFDNIPAPLISVQDGAIECFAPFEITQTTQITVVNNGQASNSVRMLVRPTNPQILTVLNQDGTANSASNPAQRGSVIVLYVSGLGVTTPLSVDGLVNTAPLPVPVATFGVSATAFTLEFVGAAPGLIAGITQVNLLIPPGSVLSGNASVSVGSAVAPLFIAP